MMPVVNRGQIQQSVARTPRYPSRRGRRRIGAGTFSRLMVTLILPTTLLACSADFPGFEVWVSSRYPEPVTIVLTGGKPGTAGVQVSSFRVEPDEPRRNTSFVNLSGGSGQIHVFDLNCIELSDSQVSGPGSWNAEIQGDGDLELTKLSDRGPTDTKELAPGGTLCGLPPDPPR